MLPPDGRKLEDIIGSLQSEMGVPQSPQEYRLTIKVVDDKDAGSKNGAKTKPAPSGGDGRDGRPKREKAPAAPRFGAEGSQAAPREKAPSRRRRSRRRRRGGRGKGGNDKGSSP